VSKRVKTRSHDYGKENELTSSATSIGPGILRIQMDRQVCFA
jgi:hypothetical protein